MTHYEIQKLCFIWKYKDVVGPWKNERDDRLREAYNDYIQVLEAYDVLEKANITNNLIWNAFAREVETQSWGIDITIEHHSFLDRCTKAERIEGNEKQDGKGWLHLQ